MYEDEIRSYRPSDQQDIVQFFRAAFEAMGFGFDLSSKDVDLQNIPGEYQANAGLFLLARRREELIGTIAIRNIAGNACELKRFYVASAHQRRGVGSSLLKRAIADAKSGRWSCIRLDTSFKSPAAISLFRKHGFVEIPKYNDDPFAEVFMELKIGG
jgi:ribosomal protein S18 acetylase RimI-like enzyme